MVEPARGRLEEIIGVTWTVPDLAAVEQAYTRWLGYMVVDSGKLGADAATTWGCPAEAGRPYLVLQPESGEAVWLRFVEKPDAAGWQALTTHGWNVAEFVVQDVDALASSFEGSPFRIIGPPASLQRFPMIRAMQALGPAGECLYFTQVGPGSGLDLARAESFVGRVFIVVAGGPDIRRLFSTYLRFENDVDPPVSTRVRVISAANGLPEDTTHAHGLVKLGAGTLIELDEYPPVTRPRACADGRLPPGMAIVSFRLGGADPADYGPVGPALFPGTGKASTCIRGCAAELVELVER